ncbi:MAG TPA: serine protease [Pirellulaceae bacterium]|nr:serine protease [Pirellulaceae bacterium]
MKSSFRFTRILLAVAALAASLAMAVPAWADAKVYEEALQSTTWVLTKTSGKTSSGTGVLVDLEKRLVVTNFHVVGEARTAIIFFPAVENGKPIVARKHYVDNLKTLGIRGKVLGVDRKRDLALIQLDKLPEKGVKAITLAADSAKPGEDVESVGNPGSSDALWVYTSGKVRSVYRKQFRTGAGDHDFMVVETTSPINTGDSGGPVVNAAGELIAISQAISPSARLVSYMVDVSEIKLFLTGPWKPAPLPVTDVLTAAELEYSQHTTGNYEIQFEQEDKSKQPVFITKDIEYYEKADTRKIWSLAATLKQAPKLEVAIKLLDQSGRTKLGNWSIEQTQTGEFLVIYLAKIDATASPDAVRSTMEYVAKLTAIMKKELTAKDGKATVTADSLDEWLK